MSTATRRQFLAAVATAPVLAAASAQEPAPAKRRIAPLAATLILVRHTEKAKSDGPDPELSEAGVARAAEFARMFGHAGVTGLVHTEYIRTRDTLAPLAEAREIDMESIGARNFAALVTRLSAAKADEVIAVAGHSNTIPALAYAFGVTLPGLEKPKGMEKAPHGNLPHAAYDRAHVLTPGEESARLVELRYGEPS